MTSIKIITIGKLKISVNSLIVIIIGLLSGIILSFFGTTGWILGIIIIIASIIGAYTLDCTIVGNCTIYTWIATIVIPIIFIVITTMVILNYNKSKFIVYKSENITKQVNTSKLPNIVKPPIIN
jgi:hypothetical protein